MFNQFKSQIEKATSPDTLTKLGLDVPRALASGKLSKEEFAALVDLGKARREILKKAEEVRKKIETPAPAAPQGEEEDPFSQKVLEQLLDKVKKASSQEELKGIFEGARLEEKEGKLTAGEMAKVCGEAFFRLKDLTRDAEYHPLTKSLLDRLAGVSTWEAYDQAMKIAFWRQWEPPDFALLDDAFLFKFQVLKRALPREPLPPMPRSEEAK